MWDFFHGSCSRVQMCLAGWDQHGWDWVVGVLQYMNTFKSLARHRQTAHLWGHFARVVLLAFVTSTVRAGSYSRQTMFGRLTVDNHRNYCSLHGPIRSGESSECRTVQCPRHRDKCLTVAQYYDVKNIKNSEIMLSTASLETYQLYEDQGKKRKLS